MPALYVESSVISSIIGGIKRNSYDYLPGSALLEAGSLVYSK